MPSLTGQLLVAMPQMADPFFDHSVIYLCAHSEETGAMGLVVNKTIDSLTVGELYEQLKIEPAAHSSQPVHFGRPVAPGQGFVLHSADYRDEGTLGIGDEGRHPVQGLTPRWAIGLRRVAVWNDVCDRRSRTFDFSCASRGRLGWR